MVLLSWSKTSVPAGTVTCFVPDAPELGGAVALASGTGLADPAAGLAFEVVVCAVAARLAAIVRRIKLRMSTSGNSGQGYAKSVSCWCVPQRSYPRYRFCHR